MENPPDLTTQTLARQQARRRNEDWKPGMPIAIAVPWPLGCWGGQEKGWVVTFTWDANSWRDKDEF